MSMWTSASDELTNYLAQRELERQRDLAQSSLLNERRRRGQREDAADDRQRTLFNQQQEDRTKTLADAAKAKQLEETVSNLSAQRQASLNAQGSTVDLPTGMEGGGTQTVANPMGAQATRNALAVALRVAGAGEVADKGLTDDRTAASAMAKQAAVQAYQANPTPQGALNLKLNYNIEVPKPEKRDLTQVSPGARLVDPETGEVVYTAPREPRAPREDSWSAPIETEGGLVQVSSSGTVRPLTGPTGAPLRKSGGGSEKFTEGQTNAATFADRMADAAPIIDKHEAYGASSVRSRIDRRLPGELQSPAAAEYLPAKTDFITAVLRKESGAAISPGEFAKADEQYFPQPGDTKQAIDDKRARRKAAAENMRRAAGPAARPPSRRSGDDLGKDW